MKPLMAYLSVITCTIIACIFYFIDGNGHPEPIVMERVPIFVTGLRVPMDVKGKEAISKPKKRVSLSPAVPPNGHWVRYYAKVTAYTTGAESCGIYSDGKTSIGVDVHSGDPDELYGIAADPSVLPYGTFIYIPQYNSILKTNKTSITSTKWENVDDTGVAMRNFSSYSRHVDGNNRYISFHLDVRFRQLSTAKEWGIKHIPVYVWEKY